MNMTVNTNPLNKIVVPPSAAMSWTATTPNPTRMEAASASGG